MKYTVIHEGASFAGIDKYHCNQCNYSTYSEKGIKIHISNFHHEVKVPTIKELRVIAKENGLAIRGTKAELLKRLEGVL